MKLDKELLYGFSGAVLSARFDDPKPTPEFHLTLWDLCTASAPFVAIAAPRGHAKTTAVTHAFVLANVLFRICSNVLILSDTEAQAVAFLGNIKMELKENDILRGDFHIDNFDTDNETEIIVRFKDGEMFRIIARGAGQKLRGTIWRNKRPDLIVCDDMENEELVANDERRDKFKRWFYGTIVPAGKRGCKIRVVGTILHLDGLLENLLNDKEWVSARFEAHDDNFENILWPEQFSKEDLQRLQRSFIAQGLPDVYSREYRNIPISMEHAFFRADDFLPITKPDEPLNYYMTCDLAVSTSNQADYSVFVIGGLNSQNVLKIVEVIRTRMTSNEIIDTLFGLYSKYRSRGGINIVGIEGGPIARALMPIIQAEMLRRNTFIELIVQPPIGDKKLRAQPIRARMRQKAVQFDKDAYWFGDFINELLVFDKGRHDDQVDALAWLGQLLNQMHEGPTSQDLVEEEYQEFLSLYQDEESDLGMDYMTGY